MIGIQTTSSALSATAMDTNTNASTSPPAHTTIENHPILLTSSPPPHDEEDVEQDHAEHDDEYHQLTKMVHSTIVSHIKRSCLAVCSSDPNHQNTASFRLRVAASDPYPSSPELFTQCHNQSGHATRRDFLILLNHFDLQSCSAELATATTNTSSASPATNDHEVVVFGMAASEYITPTATYVYIEKVDSTGFGLPTTSSTPPETNHHSTTISRELIRGYILSVVERYQTKEKIQIHSFARPQPEYLFRNSSKNNTKRILDGINLCSWWKKTLTLSIHTCDVQAWYYLPGESTPPSSLASEDSTVIDPIRGFKWNYGYPSTSLDLPAADTLPQFPDDPKSKVMKLLSSSTSSLHEALEMMSHVGECSGGTTGLFALVITPISNDANSCIHNESQEDQVDETCDEEFTALRKYLMSLDFGNMDEAIRSTLLVGKKFVLVYNTCSGILKLNPVEPDSSQSRNGGIENCSMLIETTNGNGIANRGGGLASVMDIQSLVKKRKVDKVGKCGSGGEAKSGPLA
ncbi:hypothetical protein SeMB42_g06549 [Synchytrium endobioticum]|uniref:histone acetyltransferase n=1 Tax=Synchytrium endobioticum TaxID=286115 RepID=A0A507D9W7_9FUNG|nr:hypothetical protein SeMB42_g06549 [Synchytrium endobioticum]TPX48459.1 hypothetical protein SeLEV6574_g02023 [Synchytrium endobioticum]